MNISRMPVLVLACFAACACLVGTTDGQGTNIITLAEARSRYQSSMESLSASYAKKLGDMPAEYMGMLDSAERAVQGQGDLDGTIAIRNERNRFKAERTIPENDSADDRIEIIKGRQKYRDQVAKSAIDNARRIVDLFDQHTNGLCVLKKKLTKDGRIEEAVAVQAEEYSVQNNEAVRSARAAVSAADAALAAIRPKTPEAAQAKPDSDASGLLDTVRIARFEYNSNDLGVPVNVLSRFIGVVHSKGIKARIAPGGKLKMSGVSFENGAPRYRVNGSTCQEGGDVQTHTHVDETVRSILTSMCSRMGVAFKVESPGRGVVIFDEGALKAAKSGDRDVGAILDSSNIRNLQLSLWDLRSPGEVLYRFSRALRDKGLPLRVEADSLGITSVTYEDGGMPRFESRRRERGDERERSGTLVINNVTGRSALHTICLMLGLGYRIDKTFGEIVILDRTDPDAQWAALDLSVSQLLDAFKTDAGRKKYAGRPFMARGRVTKVVSGLADIGVSLDRNVRASFAKDSVGEEQTANVRTRYTENERRNRQEQTTVFSAEAWIVGELSAASTAKMLAMEKCRLLGVWDAQVRRD